MTVHPPGTAMVAGPHALGNQAAARVLAEGGNAIEAAVAASAALCVVYPHFCGLGGDAIWLLADARGTSACVMGIGQAPLDLSPVGAREPLPSRGAGALLTSAGLVASWATVLDRSQEAWGGTLSFPRLLEEAIVHARDGFEISPSQRFWTAFRQEELSGWPGFAARFAPGGEHFRQPELAATLESLAQDGPRGFYQGPLARRIAAGLEAAGSPLRAGDLALTAAAIVPPLVGRFGAFDLLAPPPPSQGLTTLQIMAVLDRLGIAAHPPGSEGFYHLCVEAVKQAFLRRDAIADPDFAPDAAEAGLDPDALARMAASISPDTALPWPVPHRAADTVFFAVVDAEGRSVSVLQSLYFDWGSGIPIGDTGILWHNRGAGFSTRPGHPNRLVPGKRPFHTLNPGMALRAGRPAFLYGTQGADGQPQTLSVLLCALLAHGLSPEAALGLPRFLLGRTFSDATDTLKLEAHAGPGVIGALGSRGHAVRELPALSPLMGQAGVVAIRPDGRIEGAHDPRGDGGVLTVPLPPLFRKKASR